jgi:hypothetical protein
MRFPNFYPFTLTTTSIRFTVGALALAWASPPAATGALSGLLLCITH